MVIHVDMDSFFVSVERIMNSSLVGKPVAVGGSADSRGVVSSASYEARQYGVRSAMPMSEAKRRCPRLVIVPHSPETYGKYSKQIHEIFCHYSPTVQMASLDEGYLDMSGTDRLWKSNLHAAHLIRSEITDKTGLPCSLGIGSNKLIAKVASGLSKPAGVLWIPHGSEKIFLGRLAVRKLPGVGKKAEEVLRSIGVRTVSQVQNLGKEHLRKRFGAWGEDLFAMAEGISNSEVVPYTVPKSIGAEETFDVDIREGESLRIVLSQLTEKVASRARGKGAMASTIQVKYRYVGFETHTVSRSLSVATDDEKRIFETGWGAFSEVWDGRPIRLLGVSLGNLHWEEEPMDFLEQPEREKRKPLLEAIDRAAAKHGKGTIMRGSSLESPKTNDNTFRKLRKPRQGP